MILKALYDYYHRSGDLPPMGFEKKEIYFIIVIKEDGTFVRIEDTRDGKTPKSYIVPRSETRTVGIKANLLWDNTEYVLGLSKEFGNAVKCIENLKSIVKGIEDKEILNNNDAKKYLDELIEKTQNLSVCDSAEKATITENLKKAISLQKAFPKSMSDAKKKNEAFFERCKIISKECPNSTEFKAICSFYDKGVQQVEFDSKWRDVLKENTRNISFQLEYALDIIPSIKAVKDYLSGNDKENKDSNLQLCLVTGNKGTPVRLTTSTSIPGSQATASLVAFQKSSGYDSYGKEQCGNAPISEEAEAAYVTALKRLTARDSKNKFYIGNRTFLFWASNTNQESQEVEEGFFALLGNTNIDDPNKNIAKVKETMKSIWSGLTATSSDDRFYILGLAPNAARIAVVYWNDCSLKDFASKILQHFDDMEIVDGRKEKKPYAGIYSMLSAVTLGGKSSDTQPNLPEAVLKSIVQGLPYPFPLYSSCLRRICAEQGATTIARTAIIKAYLNRLNSNNNKLKTMLDKENTNQGYLCGRLFAVLDKIQEDANHINSIRERYMNAASTTPSSVFATILNLSSHHAEKLNEGSKVFYEKLKQEIIGNMASDGFPAHLDLQDQGRFFVGYYQQRADFFKGKQDNDEQ